MGFSDFLTKPIDRAIFKHTLAKYLPVDEQPADEKHTSSADDIDAKLLKIKIKVIQKLPLYLQNLIHHATTQQWDELKMEAHKLKGLGGGSICFPEITETAGELESDAKEKNQVFTISQQTYVIPSNANFGFRMGCHFAEN